MSNAKQTLYEEKILPRMDEIKRWCDQGALDVEIAVNLGVSTSTLYKYKLKFPEFSEAISVAKEAADAHVEAGLYKRACGYKYNEVTHKPIVDVIAKKLIKEYSLANPDAKKITIEDVRRAFRKETIEVSRTSKTVPPDTAAAMAWLTNRQKDMWRHRSEQLLHVDGDAEKLLDAADKRVAAEREKLKKKGKKDGSVIDIAQGQG